MPKISVILITSSHIEVSTCKISFPFIRRFPHSNQRIRTIRCGFPDAGHPIVESGHFRDHSNRVVAFPPVGRSVTGKQVKQITVGIVHSMSPPTVGKRMLDVHALHSIQSVELTNDVTVTVAHRSVRHTVGHDKARPGIAFALTTIVQYSLRLYQLMKRGFQLRLLQPFHRPVIILLSVSHQPPERKAPKFK